MKDIINLIKLNYYSLLSMGKSLIIGMLFGIGYQFFGGLFLYMGPAILLLMFNYSSIAYEDRCKMNNLIYLLPIKQKQYILAKYIYGVINTFIVVIISNIINILIGKFNINSSTTFGVLTGTILFTGFMIVAIVIPISIIVGFNKGRYIVAILAVMPACFSNAFAEIIKDMSLNTSNSTISVIIISLCLVFTVISYLITSKLYVNKEIE